MESQDDNAMRLAPGYGIVPEHQRNGAYAKLGIKPGEGGIRVDREASLSAAMEKAATKAFEKLLAERR